MTFRMIIQTQRRRGSTAVLAMMFLVLISTLAIGMAAMGTMNVQGVVNQVDAGRARANAETGVRWMIYRIQRMPRPKTASGVITQSVMDSVWEDLKTKIAADLATMASSAERTVTYPDANTILTAPISAGAGGGSFQVIIERLPWDATPEAPQLRLISTGSYTSDTRGTAARTVSLDLRVEKKINFAVVGKVPIQVGRNTLIEGPVAMATAGKFPPLLSLSDFRHLTDDLRAEIDDFLDYVEDNNLGYDNRIPVSAATDSRSWDDANADGFIDEWDLFVGEFDTDGDYAVSKDEFTRPGGGLYDPDLFAAIDSLGMPLFDGDVIRQGLVVDAATGRIVGDGVLDRYDGYAKVRGTLDIAATEQAWKNNLASQGKTIYDMLAGPIVTDSVLSQPVNFGMDQDQLIELEPSNFEGCSDNFKAKSGTAAGATQAGPGYLKNASLAPAYANGGYVIEETPKGSRNFQAVYKRPVFKNMVLENVRIPKGLNPLFINCTFKGVTFVENEETITTSTGATTTSSSDGMNWAKRTLTGTGSTNTGGSFKDVDGDGKWDQYKAGGMSTFANLVDSNGDGVKEIPTSAEAYGTGSSDKKSLGSTKGNNVRFDGCRFEGPVAGDYATAYTHFSNSWEFTGATQFQNQWSDPNSGTTTATIVAPQANIEMGSFTDPTSAPSTLEGVVVAGNIDIRGTSVVDGCIIVTGDGAGNTTLAYFGASDSDTDAGANPEGGYGRLNIRYNPYRALPDGIDIAVVITPVFTSYKELR
jgi:hypothetical protein